MLWKCTRLLEIVLGLIVFFFLMIRRPPRSTRSDTLLPYHDALPCSGQMISPDRGTNPSFPPVDTGRGFRASRTTRPHIFRGEAQASGRLWGFRGEYEDHRYLIQGQNSLHFTCMS